MGTGSGQIQITGGVSGFSGGNGNTVKFNNDINFEVVWGSAFFNPSEFVVGAVTSGGGLNLDNKYDLNGANRILRVSSTGNGNASFTQIIRKLLTAVLFALPAGLFAAVADIDGLDDAVETLTGTKPSNPDSNTFVIPLI